MFSLHPLWENDAPEIYPDVNNRIVIPADDAWIYDMSSTAGYSGYRPRFRFGTDVKNPDCAVRIQLNIPEDYSGVTTTDGLLEYSVIGGKAVVKGFSKDLSAENLTIPATIKFEGKDLPVTKITFAAFLYAGLRTVDLGKVEEISAQALYGNNIEELRLPATLKKVGASAFYEVNRCIIDPDAKIDCNSAFNGQLATVSSLKIEDNTAKMRLNCQIYKNGKPIALYISQYRPESAEIETLMPDADGVFTFDKDWLTINHNGSSFYSGNFNILTSDPAIEGTLTGGSIAEERWTSPAEDPAEFIYIIGDVTAWNSPNDPESGVDTENSFRKPTSANADFYEAYKLPLLEKGSQLYAGTFYLPATELVHLGSSGPDYTTQFHFMTALTGWDTPEHLGAGMDNFMTIQYELDIIGRAVYKGDLSNWGIECAETTPVTVALLLNSGWPSIWVKKGEYDVLPTYNWSTVTPLFIAKNAGASEAVTDAADNADAPVEWYNLQGMRVAEPAHGKYIRRQGTRTSKILIH